MNAGLANLYTLKSWLLPSGMVEGTDHDAQILAIGRGVAGQLEEHCNRKFARVVDATFEISADRMHVVLPRYPIEVLTKLELRDDMATGWIDQGEVNGVVQQLKNASGLVGFGVLFGSPNTLLRFTWTGGYWWNEQEPDYEAPETPTEEDPDLSVLPAGATAAPDDLLLAWRLQCEWVWTKRDKLGLSIGEKQDNVFGGSLAKVVLLDGVKEQLNSFKRYALT